MENSVIAVQIANGTFVPVLNTSSKKRRRLVLTTVRDDQTNVRIELFRGSDESMSDPEYVGSLVIDNVEPAEKGSADISVLLGVDENGNLNATATDTKSGEYQSLSVGLEELDQGDYDMPDFQLSDDELTLDDLSLDEEEIDLTDQGEAEPLAADESGEPSPGDEEPLGDFDLGDFETELDELSDATEDQAAAGDVAETPSEPPEPLEDLEEPGEEPEELDLSGLEQELDEETDELDLSGFDEELEPAPTEPADEGGEELGDLSFDDLETPGEGELEEIESLEEIDLEDGEPAPAPAGTEQSSGEAGQQVTEQADTLADIADEDFSFDESFSEEPGAAEDFDLSSLTAEEGGDDESFGIDTDFEEGMVEADLGEEDFTFDEGAEDEPLFGEPGPDLGAEPETGAEEIEDTLSPEEFERLDSEPVPAAPEPEAEDEPLAPRRSNAIVFAGYIVLALAALGVLTYLVFRLMEGPPAPPLRASLLGNLSMGSILWGRPIASRRERRTRRPVVARRRG
ncbi:MAG: Hsp70 family protein [Spirochaetota bacterium]